MNVAYEYASLKYSRNGTPCPSSPHPHPSSPSPHPHPRSNKMSLPQTSLIPPTACHRADNVYGLMMWTWCHMLTGRSPLWWCDIIVVIFPPYTATLPTVLTDIIELYANCSSALLHWPCPTAPKFTLSCVTTPYRFRVTIRAVSSIVLCHNIHNLLQWQLRAPIL